jgi:transposase
MRERYKSGDGKGQITFLPTCLEDYVDEDNIVRAISAYAENLDMKGLGFSKSKPKETGCFAYNPKDMLKLYLYGYLNRITSSRALEKESRRNVEVMWLLNKLTPDDKTICNFRKENSKSLKNTFAAFLKMLCSLGLYGKEYIILDGSRWRANCNSDSSFNESKVAKRLKEIDDKIEKYLSECEEDDKSDEIDMLLKNKEKLKKIMSIIQSEGVPNSYGKREINLVDKDARLMKQGHSVDINTGYNVQTVADTQHGLITDFEITNCPTDAGVLHKMTKRTKELFDVNELTVLADKGYSEGGEIKKCNYDGITCLIAKHEFEKDDDGKFKVTDFKYDETQDAYICPVNQILSYRRDVLRRGRDYKLYYNRKSCIKCDCNSKCTAKSKFRSVYRNVDEEYKVKAATLAKENPGIFKKRKLIEHVFGTIKAAWGNRQYRTRRFDNVLGEQSLMFLAYNFLRTYHILGKEFIAQFKK